MHGATTGTPTPLIGGPAANTRPTSTSSTPGSRYTTARSASGCSGGASRAQPQKSFSLSGREEYGNKRIDYPLFGPEGNKDFRFLVVRNGGSDWGRSYLRDALLTGLLQDESWDLDRQAARPMRVYLNGKYWGLYHLREKINPRFLADHHDVDKDSLSLLEHRLTVKHGDDRAYRQLQDYLATHDLSQPEDYAGLAELMDIDNFQRLQIAQTYFDNRDAGGNIRYWRPDGPQERFRWILYDVDQGFGLHRDSGWTTNTLLFNTDPAGPEWPNPPWSTLLQRRLLTNETYRHAFVNRTLDYLHTDFSAETVLARTEAAIATVAEEMPHQLARWEGRMDYWRYHAEQLRRFARNRPAYLREHFRAYFRGGEDRAVSVSAGEGGYVLLNENLKVTGAGLRGNYFANFPLHLTAVAKPGYRFAGWRGDDRSGPAIAVALNQDRVYTLAATFEPAVHELADRVIINELCPRSKAGGDWLELYNRSDGPVDLTGWFLTDNSERRFTLPTTLLRAGEYLVVCRREVKFRETYPQVYDFIDGLPFGLNREGDRLGLYAEDGAYVNEISYTLPASTDNNFTYALALPGLDNHLPQHWIREVGPGTPGAANPAHLRSAIVPRQAFWTRIAIGLVVLLLLGFLKTWHLRPRP